MSVIAVVAAITMLLAAALAVVQRDIKRVLAYSTVSQLGYMMAGLAVGAATAGIFHLWTHAFFKALLFLGAGSVIHAVHSNDMFEMGGLRRFMPVTYATFIIGSLALAGVPPFAGFWSKDEIIAASYATGNRFVFIAALITAFLTAFYMARACTLTFFGRYRRMPVAGGADDHHSGHAAPHESPRSMTGPLVVLGVVSIVGGWVGTPVHNYFADWFHFEHAHHGEFVGWIAGVSILLAVAGIAFGWLMYRGAEYGFGVLEPLTRLGPLFRAAQRKFFFDDLYLRVFVRPVQYPIARFVYRKLDQKLIDGVVNAAGSGTVLTGRTTRSVDENAVDGVVNGVAWLTDKLSFGLRRIQTGNVQRYAAGLFAGLVVAIAVLFFSGGMG
jgi:NADH-quinone oxidoreductase subunit L